MKPGRVLLTHPQIRARVRQLAHSITIHYRWPSSINPCPVFLGVMNGALFFLADLVRAVDLDPEIFCVRLASYAGAQSTGKVRGLSQLDALRKSIAGRNVLIVDDILDTGRTLSALAAHLKKLGAADVKICVLLEKRRRHEVAIRPDWTGFKIADEFVVGYGLDYNGRYRSLKQVRELAPGHAAPIRNNVVCARE